MANNAAPEPIYSVDSSSFMDWQARYYPPDVFPAILSRMERVARDGRLLFPALVVEEIEKVGTELLKDWLKAQKGGLVPNAEVLKAALVIQGQFPGLKDPKGLYEEADAYVIALAQARGGIVVTQETAAGEKHKPKRSHFIPDVCRELGIPCISLLGLMRREGWTF